MVWDECVSTGISTKQNVAHIKDLERWISSATRDKTDVKTICFGNLLLLDGNIATPLLDHYGIDAQCGCKYIPAKDGTQANVLFLNSKDMFKGIEAQGVLSGVDLLETENLLMNTTVELSPKVVGEKLFLQSTPVFSLLFTYNLEPIVIFIYMLPRQKGVPPR